MPPASPFAALRSSSAAVSAPPAAPAPAPTPAAGSFDQQAMRRIEAARQEHAAAREERIRAEGDVARLDAEVAELCAEMEAKYGTSDLDELRGNVLAMRAAATRAIDAYVAQVAKVSAEIRAAKGERP